MTTTLQPPQAPGTPPPPRRAHAGRLPGPRGRHVGVVLGLLVGAVVMLVVATMDELSGTRVPVLSTLAAAPVGDSPRAVAPRPRPAPPATPGTCLSWQRSDAADARAVDCGGQHLFEQAGAVQLTDFPAGAALPVTQRFRQLVNERCTPLVAKYLAGKYDPNGAFRAGALKPSQKSWAGGERALRCGLQRFSRSGALYPITGKVAAQEQADIRPPGTCLGIDGRFIGDPVDCALPHSVESVGSIGLGEKFKGKFPSVGDQDEFLQPACSKLAGDYAGGGKVIDEKKLAVLWDNLTQESWNAGTRKVACNLAAQLPDRSGFAPVTGSVKGPVQVGEQAAPPAVPTAPPGAPASPVEVPDGAEAQPGPPLEEAPEPVPEPETAAEPAPQPAPVDKPEGPEPPEVKLPEDKLPELPAVPGPDDEQKPPTAPSPPTPAGTPNPLGR